MDNIRRSTRSDSGDKGHGEQDSLQDAPLQVSASDDDYAAGRRRNLDPNSPTPQLDEFNGNRFMLRGKTYVIGDGPMAAYRVPAMRLVASAWFDSFIAGIIIINAVTIGLDISLNREGFASESLQRSMLGIMEHCFLVTYLFELVLRLFALGLECVADNWVKFDILLVVSGIVTNWILEPLGNSNDSTMVLRVARLLRVARTVRILVKFRDLWVLVRSLINSAGIIFYSVFLLLLVLYIFACAGVELVTNNELNIGPNPDPDFQHLCDKYFDSVAMTMLTLVQFVTLDTAGDIYRPLIAKGGAVLAIYFMACVVVLGIVLMNLITAVIINGAMEQAQTDKEAMRMEEGKRRNKFVKEIRDMFHRIDVDCSGTITRNELEELGEDDEAIMYGAMTIGNPVEIFDCLDTDNDGELDIEEFCEGLLEVALAKSPIQLKRLTKQTANLKKDIDMLIKCMFENNPNLAAIAQKEVEENPEEEKSSPWGVRTSTGSAKPKKKKNKQAKWTASSCGEEDDNQKAGSFVNTIGEVRRSLEMNLLPALGRLQDQQREATRQRPSMGRASLGLKEESMTEQAVAVNGADSNAELKGRVEAVERALHQGLQALRGITADRKAVDCFGSPRLPPPPSDAMELVLGPMQNDERPHGLRSNGDNLLMSIPFSPGLPSKGGLSA